MRRIWLGAFLVFGLAAGVWGGESVEVVAPGGYAAAAEREIDRASSSVRLYLYLFSYQPAQPDAGPARLARALLRARERGARVEVTLDRSGDAEPGADGARNRAAARMLAEGGVEVYLSSGTGALHAKALVVDGRTALVGSSNWSSSAFTRNAEADVLIRSTAAARSLLASFENLPRERLPAASTGAIQIPLSFLDSSEGLGAIVRADDPLALAAYLHFLREGARPAEPFAVDAEALARALGLRGPKRNDDRRRIHRVLARMSGAYGLLSFEQTFNEDPVIVLTLSEGGTVSLPAEFFRHGWTRRLSFAGRSFLLWSLRYSADSPFPPRWSFAKTTLARRHKVSPWFLQRGSMELRRADLLEVQYDALTREGKGRRPNVYTPKLLYDPEAREARMKALEQKHGAEALARARRLAALVYEDWDVEGIEELIGLEKRAGIKAVWEAERTLGAKSPDNPKRSLGYLIGMLRRPD